MVTRNPPHDPQQREAILVRLANDLPNYRRPTPRELMHRHLMHCSRAVDRDQGRMTHVTAASMASARAFDVAMHYRRMLRDYFG